VLSIVTSVCSEVSQNLCCFPWHNDHPFCANNFLCIKPDGQGYPQNATPTVCPTCRGLGRVSALYIYIGFGVKVAVVELG
jgi:hypothetical protein